MYCCFCCIRLNKKKNWRENFAHSKKKQKMWLSQFDSWSLSLVMWWHLSLPALEGHPTTPPRSPDDVCTAVKRDLKAVRQQTSAEGRAAWFLGGRLLGGWKAPEGKKKLQQWRRSVAAAACRSHFHASPERHNNYEPLWPNNLVSPPPLPSPLPASFFLRVLQHGAPPTSARFKKKKKITPRRFPGCLFHSVEL